MFTQKSHKIEQKIYDEKNLTFETQGEVLAAHEATACFFAMTKLFQSKDVVLRRMVYLGIKELSSIADDVIIVTSSLTKDMTGTFHHIFQSKTMRISSKILFSFKAKNICIVHQQFEHCAVSPTIQRCKRSKDT